MKLFNFIEYFAKIAYQVSHKVFQTICNRNIQHLRIRMESCKNVGYLENQVPRVKFGKSIKKFKRWKFSL